MPRMTDDQLVDALATLPAWQQQGEELVRELTFRDSVEAIGFVVQVAALQERADHHATITNTYNNVRLALTSHDEGGITDRDVALARDIEERARALGG
ncbi:MAG: 4a-hydroxytetrahydrobiopterin dehydratase [Dehalococcoidia bacterium]